ncbi:MAG: hypothetical protein KBA31_15065 [Alphaproteobacteria bacterium]|nr:hypothetical protein [Alphaproteobacteria bacterium]
MTALKSARTLAASLGVLAFGALAATPAMAFDNVNWSWKKDVNEKVDIDVYIDVDVESTGLVEVEKLQIFLGNVTAESNVYGVANIQPDVGGHWQQVYCYCYGGYFVHDSFDAKVELPEIKSAATAVGNNQSITSDVPVFLHDGQFVANTRFNDGGWDYASLAGAVDARMGGGGDWNTDCNECGNFHTDLAVLFTLASAFGLLAPSEISATSEVGYILNASVDSTATAVANNISVNLESNVDGGTSCHTGCSDRLSNHLVIADITQFAYANVSALSDVSGVIVDNYRNLGDIGGPLVNSVATAVGNNVSINVGPVKTE